MCWSKPATTCMKAAGNWCPLGVLLDAALLHCSTSTNLPDPSLMKSKSSLRVRLLQRTLLHVAQQVHHRHATL